MGMPSFSAMEPILAIVSNVNASCPASPWRASGRSVLKWRVRALPLGTSSAVA